MALQAFQAFQWDANEDWKRYLLNLEIPEGKNREAVLQKYKAKWYQRNVDDAFDINLVIPPVPKPAPTPAHVPPPTPPQPTSYRPASSTPQPTARSASSLPSSVVSAYMDLLQLLMVLAIPFYLLPIIPGFSLQAYRAACMLGVVVHGTRLFMRCGYPSIRPFPSAALSWLQVAAPTTDAQYALQCLLFSHQNPQLLALLSPLTLAVYHTVVAGRKYLGRTALWNKYGQKLYDWLSANKVAALSLSANSEIFLGFALTLGALRGFQGIMAAYMWWSVLKLRYHSPDFMTLHRQVWGALNQKAAPYLARLPILQKGVNYVSTWFNTIQPRR